MSYFVRSSFPLRRLALFARLIGSLCSGRKARRLALPSLGFSRLNYRAARLNRRSRCTKNCDIWSGEPDQIHFLYNFSAEGLAFRRRCRRRWRSRRGFFWFVLPSLVRFAHSELTHSAIKQNVRLVQRNKGQMLGEWRTVDKPHKIQLSA